MYQLIVTALGETNFHPVRGTPQVAWENAIATLGHPEGARVLVTDRSLLPSSRNAFGTENAVTVIHATRTAGALCTALLAFDHINPELPLVIAPGDSLFSRPMGIEIMSFFEDSNFGWTLSFKSNGARWSYLRLSEKGEVTEVVEKNQVSSVATTGVFGFKRARDFLEAAEWVLVNNFTTDGRFFTSAAMNYKIMEGATLGYHNLEAFDTEFTKA